jgi:hypothetical protein
MAPSGIEPANLYNDGKVKYEKIEKGKTIEENAR